MSGTRLDSLRHAAWVLGLAGLAIAISLLRITPKLVPWHDHELLYETTKVDPMLEQLADPAGWDRVRKHEADFNGIQTIRWRLLPPVVGHALRLSPHAYLTLPWIGVAALLALVVHYALRAGATPLAAGSLGVLAGTSSAFFSATCAIGYFDPFYLIALVVATCTPSNVALVAACVLGPWIDEKFLILLPACCVARWAWLPDRRWVKAVVFAIAPYCLIRLAALGAGDDSFHRQFEMQAAVFRLYAPALPAGWWYGFRAGWVVVAVGGWFALRPLPPAGRGLFVFALLAAVGSISFLAWDTTRSIAMLLPLAVLAARVRLAPWMLPALAALNLLLPAAYVWCGRPETVPLRSILFR